MNKFINQNNKEIPVFFATDDNYVPYLYVSMQSLIDTSSIKNKYVIYILNTGLKQENKQSLKELERNNIKVKFVDVSNKIRNIKSKLEAQLRDYYSPSIFLRLFIPSLFPQYHKALYLDCDITIVDDIANLYNNDLKENLIGAIVDQVVTNNDVFEYYVENALGVNRKKYFNSGIILMNLDKFRKEKLEKKFIYLLNNYKFGTVAPDQDYLNVLCKDKVLYFDKGWDRMPVPDDDFDEKDLHLIHYNMYQKPWRYKDVMYEEYFWNVAQNTKYYKMLLEMRDSYTDEKKKKDIEAGTKLLEYAKNIADDPNNFRNTLKRECKELAEKNNLTQKSIEDSNILDDLLNVIFDGEHAMGNA